MSAVMITVAGRSAARDFATNVWTPRVDIH